MLVPVLMQLLLLSWTRGMMSSGNGTFGVKAAQQSFDCKHIAANGFVFDLSGLPAPVSIDSTEDTPPSKMKTVITLNLCQDLEKESGPESDQCPKGTRVCMKVINEKDGEDRLVQVIPAGGSESGDWPWSAELGERLEGAERALELELHGSQYNHRTQKVEIDFKCDRNAQKDSKPELKEYDKDDGKLKLRWTTPHACAKSMNNGEGGNDSKEGDSEKGDSGSSSSGWGFFSWFFFFIFVGGLAYFAIGFWRNYNEFGVIELPNKDFWREAPYIAKDMGKHIYSTVSGQGSSRGAYEPV